MKRKAFSLFPLPGRSSAVVCIFSFIVIVNCLKDFSIKPKDPDHHVTSVKSLENIHLHYSDRWSSSAINVLSQVDKWDISDNVEIINQSDVRLDLGVAHRHPSQDHHHQLSSSPFGLLCDQTKPQSESIEILGLLTNELDLLPKRRWCSFLDLDHNTI